MSDTTTLDERAWTVDEACERLGNLGRSKFYELIRTGQLEARKIGTGRNGSRTIVLQSELARYLTSLDKAEL